MAVSVRMDPLLEKELEQAARRKGITKSQFIIDAVERSLGRKNPRELMLQVQEELAVYAVSPAIEDTPVEAVSGTGEQVRQLLEAKHQAELKDWADHQARQNVATVAPNAAGANNPDGGS